MKWASIPLERLAVDIQPGFACQPTTSESGVQQIRTNNVSAEGRLDISQLKHVPASLSQIEKYSLMPGDVIFNNTNSPALVGKTAFFSESGQFLFSNHMTRIRVDRNLAEPQYVARFLHWEWSQGGFRALVTQWVNQAAINRSQLGSIKIPVPPLSEQRRIVEILDQADRLRRLRVEADTRAERVLPAILTKTLGAPATWESSPNARPIGELVDLVSGATPSKGEEQYWTGEIPWVSPKDMKQPFLHDTQDHVSAEAVDSSNLKLIESGAVLIVVRGMILARTIPISMARRAVTINQDMKALLPKSRGISGEYLWAVLSLANKRLLGWVRTAGHGTRKLDTPDLFQLGIPVPSDSQLSLVTSVVLTHEALVEGRVRSRKVIDKLFDVLLGRAFTGELTQSWRESRMTELLEEMQEQVKALAGV